MLIDGVVTLLTQGTATMDVDGSLAGRGQVHGAASRINAGALLRAVDTIAVTAGGLDLVGDHETALCGALDRPIGMILIAGTGSICFRRNARGEIH